MVSSKYFLLTVTQTIVSDLIIKMIGELTNK